MTGFLLKIIFVLAVLMLACGETTVFADEQKPGEYQVKALFLYNFINFVEWPAGSSFFSSSSMNICIVGDDPFDDALNNIRNETVKGKKLIIRTRHPFDEPGVCQILFIPASERSHMESILRSVKGENVLTIADFVEGARQGAIIGFYIEQQKVRFAVNLDAARRSGLKISAKLLRLSKIIKGTGN